MGKFKEIAIGVLAILAILIGGSIYNELLAGFWYGVIDVLSFALHKLWIYVIILGVVIVTIKIKSKQKKS